MKSLTRPASQQSAFYCPIRFMQGPHHERTKNGDSPWSTVTWNRFGSRLGFCRFTERKARWVLPDQCRRIEVGYQSGAKPPHSKGSANLRIVFIHLPRFISARV